MIKIAVVSGKGGVGKTSISAALAYELHLRGETILAVDTDVDAPNLSLILQGELKSKKEVVSSKVAEVNAELCIACGKCVKHCKPEALFEDENGIPSVIPYFCEGCGICNLVCPVDAIDIVDRISGVINIFDTVYGFKLVSGELDIGGVASGKIVKETKEVAYELADDSIDYIIIDGPPGSACPAISAISDVDFIIYITEPTPTALHDLQRLIKINATFNIPAGIIINKSDIHDPTLVKLENYLLERNIPVIGKLPYDNLIPKSISTAQPFNALQRNSKLTKSFDILVGELMDYLSEVKV
ncbi:MAG: nucleotide-binding protein [Candidatus Odinarchaeia archaeon]